MGTYLLRPHGPKGPFLKAWPEPRLLMRPLGVCRCFSYVGKVAAGGQQLSIGASCDSLATVEHELLHALGFYHEHARHDRDDYVNILFENIRAGWGFSSA